METKIVSNQYLNEDQKKVKQQIMEYLMESFPHVLSHNQNVLFDNQSLTDLVVSCVIMFCREQLVNFFINSNGLEFRDNIMDSIFQQIREGVHARIKDELNDKRHLN